MAQLSWSERLAEATASKRERTKLLVEKLRTRPTSEAPDEAAAIEQKGATAPVLEHASSKDRDLTVATVEPNEDLAHFVDLIDDVLASEDIVHAALFWPHIPPRAILPWMLREVSRGRVEKPIRTLFLNMGRPAMQAVADIGARTAKLHERGLFRSGVVGERVSGAISSDALFYMFLGDRQTRSSPSRSFRSCRTPSRSMMALTGGTSMKRR